MKEDLQLKIQDLIGRGITQFVLKGKGACNCAYYIETESGHEYIVKQEREDKEIEEQNNLLIEGGILNKLKEFELPIAIPKVVFISNELKMYGYEYIKGEKMREVWGLLSEKEKINICYDLGYFHAEIGKKVSKKISEALGIKINESRGLHPEVLKDYERLSIDPKVPENFRMLAKKAKVIFDATLDKVVFQFIHNDAHHENIIINNKKISGIIDFGDSEYGEVAKEFSRYIRDLPDHFQYIVSAYEERSGNKLSYERLITNSLISDFVDIIEIYNKGGDEQLKAERNIETYRKLIEK